jgi:MYXO-CTERM domain-containing protein
MWRWRVSPVTLEGLLANASRTANRPAHAIRVMAYRTTVGWSLVSAGVVTLALTVLPGDSVWWGFGLIILGLLVLLVRRR